jgi:hypothetical protein
MVDSRPFRSSARVRRLAYQMTSDAVPGGKRMLIFMHDVVCRRFGIRCLSSFPGSLLPTHYLWSADITSSQQCGALLELECATGQGL